MKLFLQKILIGGAILFVAACLLDYCISSGLMKMEDYRFQTWSHIVRGGNDHKVLIMGNSRGFSHFDPVIIDSLCSTDSYSIGIGGYPVNVQMMRWNVYKSHNQNPEVIIYNVDPMTFAQIEDVRHQHQSEAFFPLVYDGVSRGELKKVGYDFGELCVPLYRMGGYQQVIKNGLLEFFHLKHYSSWPSVKGHRPESGEWNGEELNKMEAGPREFNEKSVSMFENLLAEFKQEGIKVVLVFSPLYSGAVEKMTNIEEWREYFRRLAETEDVYYLDYLGNPICKDTANFCVSVHLNETMTQVFTTMFCEDLKSLNILN